MLRVRPMNHLFVSVSQGDHEILFKIEAASQVQDEQDAYRVLRDYFRADVSLVDLYQEWRKCDPKQFERVANCITGIRLLRQDPVETFFSFICSSNNNIARITKMVDALRVNYGEFVGKVGDHEFYTFPSVEALANAKEEKLRQLGMGYRANFIINSASRLKELADERACDVFEVLGDLRRSESREYVAEFLIQFPGIGRKVADCIALFSLDQLESIPVDTHVWQIAQKYYKSRLNPLYKKHKSLTDKVYADIGDMFRGLYGNYSGWAHSVLFTAELKAFQNFLENRVKTEDVIDAPIKKEENELCDLYLSNVIPFQKRKLKKRKGEW